MAEQKPKKAKAKRLPKKYEKEHCSPTPDETVLWKCTCGSGATRAVYQHSHKHEAPGEADRDAMFTWEVPAYVDSKGKLCSWKCPLCNGKEQVAPVLVKCGDCRRIVKAPQVVEG